MIQLIGLTVILRLQYTHVSYIGFFGGILVFSRYTQLGGIPTYHFSDLASSNPGTFQRCKDDEADFIR